MDAEQSQLRGAQAESIMVRKEKPTQPGPAPRKTGGEGKNVRPQNPGTSWGLLPLQPSPQSLSPWRGGVTRPTGKVIYSPLTTELTRHSEPGELMDDLTPARQPAAGSRRQALRRPTAPLSAGGRRKGRGFPSSYHCHNHIPRWSIKSTKQNCN